MLADIRFTINTTKTCEDDAGLAGSVVCDESQLHCPSYALEKSNQTKTLSASRE